MPDSDKKRAEVLADCDRRGEASIQAEVDTDNGILGWKKPLMVEWLHAQDAKRARSLFPSKNQKLGFTLGSMENWGQ